MCGIAGVMTFDGSTPAAAVLDSLADCLAHRGPDGRGRHLAGNVGLAQTRLAIIDLETGDQPLYAKAADGGQLALIANGEIYNYLELRRAMPDVAFATGSDCEPPLYLYRQYGVDFAEHLRGMYAIALHDTARDRLVLSRDPFGIKPLYYVLTATHMAFASEPQALIRAGLAAAEMRVEGRDQLLQLQFTCGRETVYAGIERVMPGETVVFENGRLAERRHHPALPALGPRTQSETEAMASLDAALVDSVTVHQRSDVPYGMFLSGGIDSSAVLALMRDLNEAPVRAFTVGFSGTDAVDERDHAEAVATAAGARFEAVDFDEADFWRLLPRIAGAMDDPAADYAVLPSFKLAELARARDLKVILTGEGGDELFGGYGRYRRAARWRLFGGRPMRKGGILDGLDVLRQAPAGWRDGIAQAESDAAGIGRTSLQRCQSVDCADWLPNDLLTKLDRCLMAHGVEGRVPFLDPRVANVAYRLPDRLKVRKSLGKWLLRRWLDGKLPEARPFTPKRGFTVPVGEWIQRRGGQLGPLVAAQPGIAEACRPDAVEALFNDSGKKIGKAAWTLLFFALWHNHHILGQPSGDDVLETLTAR
jgi:asparagine synthase (glutamine-hydrolysing)